MAHQMPPGAFKTTTYLLSYCHSLSSDNPRYTIFKTKRLHTVVMASDCSSINLSYPSLKAYGPGAITTTYGKEIHRFKNTHQKNRHPSLELGLKTQFCCFAKVKWSWICQSLKWKAVWKLCICCPDLHEGMRNRNKYLFLKDQDLWDEGKIILM